MNNHSDKRQVLAALAAQQKSDKETVDEAQIAAFIDGALSEKERSAVLKAFARNPELLNIAVQVEQTVKADVDKASNIRPSLVAKVRHWFNKMTAVGSLSGGIAIAAVAYFALVPSINLNRLETELLSTAGLVNYDAGSFKQYVPKSFDINLSKAESSFNQGVALAQARLSSRVELPTSVSCDSQGECNELKAYSLLGQWYVMSSLQCDSPYSVDSKFWRKQASIYSELSSYLGGLGAELPNIDSELESEVCDITNQLNKRMF